MCENNTTHVKYKYFISYIILINISIFLTLSLSCRLIFSRQEVPLGPFSPVHIIHWSDQFSRSRSISRSSLFIFSWRMKLKKILALFLSIATYNYLLIKIKNHFKILWNFLLQQNFPLCPGNQCLQNNLFSCCLLCFAFSSYLYWGQTWASGWIFRNVTLHPRGHHW